MSMLFFLFLNSDLLLIMSLTVIVVIFLTIILPSFLLWSLPSFISGPLFSPLQIQLSFTAIIWPLWWRDYNAIGIYTSMLFLPSFFSRILTCLCCCLSFLLFSHCHHSFFLSSLLSFLVLSFPYYKFCLSQFNSGWYDVKMITAISICHFHFLLPFSDVITCCCCIFSNFCPFLFPSFPPSCPFLSLFCFKSIIFTIAMFAHLILPYTKNLFWQMTFSLIDHE